MAELALDSVRIVLNGGAYSAIPRQDGSFKLHDVLPGSYLLEVMDSQSVWPTVRARTRAFERVWWSRGTRAAPTASTP